jgi:tetratricopeptide (TPR) repeat protein
VTLQVTHPLRRAQTHCGLGNIALRNTQWPEAIDHYQSALALYRDAGGSDSDQVRILNNLLVCYTRQGDTQQATATITEAYGYGETDVLVFGEFLATQAQWAWESGQPERAAALIPQAKEWLGEAVVVSWVTVRVLDLQMGQVPLEAFVSRLQELEDRLTAVSDERWVGALRLALVRVAWEAGHPEAVQQELAILERLWPFMG